MRPPVRPGVNVGFISLLMIFVVLCLTVFIALSLQSASVDKNLTFRMGETALAYYDAQNRLQKFLSELDSFLLDWDQGGERVEAAEGVVDEERVVVGEGDGVVGEGEGIVDEGNVMAVEEETGDGQVFLARLRAWLDSEAPAELAYNEGDRVIRTQWPAGERLILQAEILINVPATDLAVTRYSMKSVLLAPVQENIEKPLNNLWSGEDFFQ